MQWRTHRLWKRRGWAGLARLWGRRGAQDSRAGARPGRCCRLLRANTSAPPRASGGPAPRVRRPPAGAVRVRTGVQASVTRAQRHAHAPCAPGGAEGAERRGGRRGGSPPETPPKVARRRQPRGSARTARSSHSRPAVRVRRNAPFRRPRYTVLRWLCRARPSARIFQHRASVSAAVRCKHALSETSSTVSRFSIEPKD
jgi:hypothetical protein